MLLREHFNKSKEFHNLLSTQAFMLWYLFPCKPINGPTALLLSPCCDPSTIPGRGGQSLLVSSLSCSPGFTSACSSSGGLGWVGRELEAPCRWFRLQVLIQVVMHPPYHETGVTNLLVARQNSGKKISLRGQWIDSLIWGHECSCSSQ